jgi:hypothetical protein
MLAGYGLLIAGQLLLINVPERNYPLLLASVILETCAVPLTGTFMDKLVVITVDPAERARVLSILYVVVIIFTSPFGWIAGQLSEIDRTLPFVLNLGFLVVGAVLVMLAGRLVQDKKPVLNTA